MLLPKLAKAQLAVVVFCSAFQATAEQSDTSPKLTLTQAVTFAQNNDPWLKGNQLQQSAVESRSIAANTWADPQVSISALNLPTDGWDLNQEGMTQLKVGVSQMLPRGDSLAIKSDQLKTESTKFPLLRSNRQAQVERQVSQLWLDAYLAQKTISLINQDRSLFEQMVNISKASYKTTAGKTRQHDVIRAQLELIRLDDRLVVEQQKLEAALAALSQWFYQDETGYAGQYTAFNNANIVLDEDLPTLSLSQRHLVENQHVDANDIAHLLASHPSVLAIDVKEKVAKKSVELANEQYKPQWGVNASYGYRDEAENGMSRADFFSVGVTFDLPLFTQNRQDKQVAASIAESEAVKTEKLLLIRNMLAEVEKERRILAQLRQRQTLYEQQLMTQTHEQAEASLTAYTNDDGDFAEVVRSRISELNTTIDKVKIDVEMLKTIARLNYFFTQSEPTHAK